MKESLDDSSMKETSSIHSSVQSEVRHMMIIDCSEDSSVIRLVFQRGILPYQHLRFYVCGDFPGDIHGGGSDMRASLDIIVNVNLGITNSITWLIL